MSERASEEEKKYDTTVHEALHLLLLLGWKERGREMEGAEPFVLVLSHLHGVQRYVYVYRYVCMRVCSSV